MVNMSIIEVKSKFGAEYRRFCLGVSDFGTFDKFREKLQRMHNLQRIDFVIQYVDPNDNELLPITNDMNLVKAYQVTKNIMRLLLLRKGETTEGSHSGTFLSSKKGPAEMIRNTATVPSKITLSDDFRQVSSIIDVDIVPETMRRVRLIRSANKPLGFYIRDGMSYRTTNSGLERVPGIFISRLSKDGLAESTGLLAVHDEIIEVNGIDVRGKSLDQVTDMMVANSNNLIITVKPANQSTCLVGRKSANSTINSYNGISYPSRPGLPQLETPPAPPRSAYRTPTTIATSIPTPRDSPLLPSRPVSNQNKNEDSKEHNGFITL